MIDDMERAVMSAPIEARERALELMGPVWRPPGLKAVLGQLPFLRSQPGAVRGMGRGPGAGLRQELQGQRHGASALVSLAQQLATGARIAARALPRLMFAPSQTSSSRPYPRSSPPPRCVT